MKTPIITLILLLSSPLIFAAPVTNNPETEDLPIPTQEDPFDEKPEIDEQTLNEVRSQIPKLCNLQCSQAKKPWLGRIILPGTTKSVDYLKAYIAANTSFTCVCKNVQTSKNNAPIWSDQDARKKCPTRCANEIDNMTGLKDMRWTGHWWTTVWGKHSVCQCASQ